MNETTNIIYTFILMFITAGVFCIIAMAAINLHERWLDRRYRKWRKKLYDELHNITGKKS